MPIPSKGKLLLAIGLSPWVLFAWTLPAGAQSRLSPVVGKEWIYTVQPTDTLSRIATRHALDLRRLLAINGLTSRKPLRAGQTIHLSDRHVPPPADGATLVINIPDGLLYRYEADSITIYPIGLGEPTAKTAQNPARWRTPVGSFTVVEKRKNPAWNVPPSIQEEMRDAGKTVLTQVAPGPKNPLGTRWIGLSAWGYGIHGTNAPASIGRYSTHGCIRMRSEHVEEIFDRVAKGTNVRIVYQPAKLAVDGNAVYLEVSRDVYRQIPDMKAHVQRLIRDAGLTARVDPAHVRSVIKVRGGIATRVDRGAPAPFPKSTPSPTPSPIPVPSASTADPTSPPASPSQESP